MALFVTFLLNFLLEMVHCDAVTTLTV